MSQSHVFTITSPDGLHTCTVTVNCAAVFTQVEDGGGDDGGGQDGGGGEIPVGDFVNHIPFETLPGDMSLNQCDVILSLVSIAENSDIDWSDHYNYAENIGDGRGITFSIAGFCSGTGDGILVLRELQKINPSHLLCKYIVPMSKVSGGNVTGLSGFIRDVRALGDDKQWQQAVWIILSKMYWKPAMDMANKYGCVLPITKGFIYDTCINHGSDSVEGPIISRLTVPAPSQGGDEKAWLSAFIARRRRIITVEDQSLDDGQPDRADMWKTVLTAGNINLLRPVTNLTCYGDNFIIS